MHAVRAALLASAFTALGCSAPYEYTQPPLDPDDGRTPLPGPTAQPDTPECLQEGTEILPDAGAGPALECCPGLERVEVYRGSILRLDTCEPEGGGHAFCIRCGDGRCGVGENTCSCEADCRWP
jgi:hypothetical protein